MIVGFDYQSGTPYCPYPVLAILDAGAELASLIPSLNVYMYRLMDYHDCVKLPRYALCQPFNEQDQDKPARTAAVDFVRTNRPDLKIVYGGDIVNPATGRSYAPDFDLLAKCDFYGIHAAVMSPPLMSPTYPTTHGLKPIIVTELEIDPNEADHQRQLVPSWCTASPVPTFVFSWFWRDGDQRLSFSNYPDLCKEIAHMADTPATITISLDDFNALKTRIDALEARDGLITEALLEVADGKYSGAGGVAGKVVALRGGTPIDVSQVQPDVSPNP